MSDVRLRRIYEEPDSGDGKRVLVDRLWPRGLPKQAARIDEWAKDVAPSDQLRRWYGHDPAKFNEFRRRYLAELREPERLLAFARLAQEAGTGTLTLLTASRDLDRSQAAVLAERLRHAGDVPGDPACLLRRVCPECGGVAAKDAPTTCPHCGTELRGD